MRGEHASDRKSVQVSEPPTPDEEDSTAQPRTVDEPLGRRLLRGAGSSRTGWIDSGSGPGWAP